MKYKKITNYESNTESPFIERLLEVKITNRRKLLAGTANDLVDSETGEVMAVNAFAAIEKVDNEQFTKIYKEGLAAMYGLSRAGIRVFSFIATIAKPNKDSIIFEMDDCKEFTKYKTHAPIMTGLAELIENKFIARSNKHYRYFINPKMFFNGSRVAFIKMYYKENNYPTDVRIINNNKNIQPANNDEIEAEFKS